MNIEEFNALPDADAKALLADCCGSRRWAERMIEARPYRDLQQTEDAAEQVWWQLEKADWQEAFASHPEIGSRTGSAQSQAEQSGMASAPDRLRNLLAEQNRNYRERFGYIFLTCATGKQGEQMQAELQQRLANKPDEELKIAAAEQAKITALRLRKLLTE